MPVADVGATKLAGMISREASAAREMHGIHQPGARACRRADWQFLLVTRSWRIAAGNACTRSDATAAGRNSPPVTSVTSAHQIAVGAPGLPPWPVVRDVRPKREAENARFSVSDAPRWTIVHAGICRSNSRMYIQLARGDFAIAGVSLWVFRDDEAWITGCWTRGKRARAVRRRRGTSMRFNLYFR